MRVDAWALAGMHDMSIGLPCSLKWQLTTPFSMHSQLVVDVCIYFSHVLNLWLSMGESISCVNCVANRVEREPDPNECL